MSTMFFSLVGIARVFLWAPTDPRPQTATLLDMYTLLQLLPDILLAEKRRARMLHRQELDIFLELYRGMKQKARNGTAPVGSPFD